MSVVALMSALAVMTAQEAPQTAATPPAEAPAPVTTAAAAPEEPDPLDRRVCRTEAVVGTRFNSRVCMTQREWDRRQDESRRLAHRLEAQNSNRGRVTAPSTGGFD